jgi:hypothetical protein
MTITVADTVCNKTCDKVHMGVFHFHGAAAPIAPGPAHC